MNQNLVSLVDRIRHRFPQLDVRTDQCDTVRVIAKGVLVGIEEEGGGFTARFFSLNADFGVETTMIREITSFQSDDFESKVIQEMASLAPHSRPAE